MRVILAGGGTGGHIYPAITIAGEFRRRAPQTELLFIGGKRGLEAELIPKEGFRLITLHLEGIPRPISLKVFKSLGLACNAIWKTYKIIKEFQPDLVIGTGGYVCGPTVMTAYLMGIPTAIQEQNAFPGLTNRLLGKMVQRVFIAYPEAGKYFQHQKVRVCGNPIRTAEFLNGSRRTAERNLGIQPDRLNLLVFGGSQSARRINQCLLEILAKTFQEFTNLQIILMTGLKDYESMQAKVKELDLRQDYRARLLMTPYFYKIADAYRVADLVLARSRRDFIGRNYIFWYSGAADSLSFCHQQSSRVQCPGFGKIPSRSSCSGKGINPGSSLESFNNTFERCRVAG